ncbi:MAG: exo-alpha-sialidase [Candidatus Hydrogenedentes bacterium]|nr:exo-alpha-sialidase [Candidatus Hydrogenedentota bacterium]
MTNTAPEPEPEYVDDAKKAPTNIHVLTNPAERDLSSDIDVEDVPPTPKVLPLHTPDRPIQPIPDTEHDLPKKKRPRWLRFSLYMLTTLLLVVALFGAWLAYAYFRPNAAEINPALKFETWSAVDNGKHNSNTDMIYWRGAFYMIHASSPWHFGSSECKLVLHKSRDAKQWETIAEFHAPGQNDIRDPKFAAIGSRLYLYALINDSVMATPEATSMTYTADGENWEDLREIEPKGWLFWRPKTRDNITWYCPAYWHEHGKSALLKSIDGENWEQVSIIHEGDANDETDCEFLPDGRIVATARLEVEPDTIFGHRLGRTLIATAGPPYEHWLDATSYTTRLDGPYVFEYKGQTYAIGRRNPDPNAWPNQTGSILGRKRTAIYKVEPDALTWLTDLPSAGDTSYAGVVVHGDTLYASYYTSDINRDWPWIIGMLSPSEIRMVKIELPSLDGIAKKTM